MPPKRWRSRSIPPLPVYRKKNGGKGAGAEAEDRSYLHSKAPREAFTRFRQTGSRIRAQLKARTPAAPRATGSPSATMIRRKVHSSPR